MNEIENLKRRITDLEEYISSKKIQQISFPVDEISQTIISDTLDVGSTISTSSKAANSENQTVVESGSASYTVLKNPDTFLQVEVNGITYYLPAFT